MKIRKIRLMCAVSASCVLLSSLAVPQIVRADEKSYYQAYIEAMQKQAEEQKAAEKYGKEQTEKTYQVYWDAVRQQAIKEQEAKQAAERYAQELLQKQYQAYLDQQKKQAQEAQERREQQARLEQERYNALVKYYQDYYKNYYSTYYNNTYNTPTFSKDGLARNSLSLKDGSTSKIGGSWAFYYWSDNPEIASVDDNGIVKANRKGHCTIISRSYDLRYTMFTDVTVK